MLLHSIFRAPISFKVLNIRQDWREVVDLPACGPNAGMVLSIVPIYNLLAKYNLLENAHIILLCPRGTQYTQARARELEKLSEQKTIVFICGHYEGVDERITHFISERISIGKYVLSSGTLAAAVILESIVRLIPKVISRESLASESFNDSEINLDLASYTLPRNFKGYKIPEEVFRAKKLKVKKP